MLLFGLSWGAIRARVRHGLGVLLLAVGASAQLDWGLDLNAALAAGRARERPVLACVHEAGEARSAAMAAVYANPRFVKLAQAVVTVLVLHIADGGEAAGRALLGSQDLEHAREQGMRATLALFGPGAAVTTPQQLLLDPWGGVLWHNLGTASPSELERAVSTTRAALQDSTRSRARRFVALGERLARAARRDDVAHEKLRVLARSAPVTAFAEVMEAAAREGLARHDLMAAAFTSLPECTRHERFTALRGRPACRAASELAQAMAAPECPRAAGRAREVFGPLPELRAAEELTAVRFTDGRARSLAEARGKVVVLWFVLLENPRLAEQVAAVAPAIDELTAAGVHVLALAPCSDAEVARRLAAAELLPCPVGTYRWDPAAPWQGVDYFPAAIVIDAEGRLVYDDHGPGAREYAGFAATARGLQHFLAARPRLVHGR